VGYDAGASAAALTNTTAIGNGAKLTGSNMVRVGNNAVTSIGGYAAWTSLSDARVKKNIQPNVPGLAFINLLQPVTYNLDLDAADKIQNAGKEEETLSGDALPLSKEEAEARAIQQSRVYTGFIAQEVEKAAQGIGYDFSGIDAPESEAGLYGLRYSTFVVPLVKAVQELSEQSDAKDEAIARLQEQLTALTEAVESRLALAQQASVLRSAGNATGTETVKENIASASLQQNYPNPFDHSTIVGYTLPETFRAAHITITNAAGKTVKRIPLSASGSSSVTIEAGSLPADIYYYSLYVDDLLIDTKKMVLTQN
jgi:hypothetical protein